MERPSVYRFDSVAEYIKVLSRDYGLQKTGRPYTAESWAKELGYNSAQTISMVISGRRPPSLGLTLKLGRLLALTASEQRYLELLGELERRIKGGHRSDPVLDEMKSLNPDFGKRQPLDAARFNYIAEWQHLVIKQLASTADFQDDPEWIRQRLKKKLTLKQVEAALETLVRLGVLQRDAETQRIVPDNRGLQTQTDIPSRAQRSHHKQMMELAMEALEEQDVTEREMTSLTLRFNPARMGDAKQAIRNFRNWFDTEFEDLNSSEVFQLNMQFFSQTKPKENKHD